MNGVYWGLTALALMNRSEALPKQEMIEWVMSCWVEEIGEHPFLSIELKGSKLITEKSRAIAGGFAPHPGHDPNIHSTLSAIQILATHDSLEVLQVDKIVECEPSSYPLSLCDILTMSSLRE